MKVGIGKAAKEVGVHPETLRRREKQGKIVMERTPTGFRRYDLAQIHALGTHKAPSTRVTIRKTTSPVKWLCWTRSLVPTIGRMRYYGILGQG